MFGANEIISGFHHLAWAQRLTYAFLLYAVYLNTWGAFENAIAPPWRKLYAFKAIVSLMAVTYYTLLISDIMKPTTYVNFARWIQPLIIVCMFTSAQLHRWERYQLRNKKAYDDRIAKLAGKDEE